MYLKVGNFDRFGVWFVDALWQEDDVCHFWSRSNVILGHRVSNWENLVNKIHLKVGRYCIKFSRVLSDFRGQLTLQDATKQISEISQGQIWTQNYHPSTLRPHSNDDWKKGNILKRCHLPQFWWNFYHNLCHYQEHRKIVIHGEGHLKATSNVIWRSNSKSQT